MPWNRNQLNTYLTPYATAYGGNGYISQYRNNRLAKTALYGMKDTIGNDALYNEYNSAFNAGMTDAAMNGGLSVIQGIGQISAQAVKNASINDITDYYNALEDYGNIGTGSYDSYAQLADEQSRSAYLPTVEYDDIRGMNGTQKIGSIASSTLSGLTAGTAVAPGIGTAIGAGIGFLAGVGSVMYGDAKAAAEKNYANSQQKIAQLQNSENVSAAKDMLDQKRRRNAWVNSNADGGQMKKQLTVAEFAELIRKNSDESVMHSGKIMHRHCSGGTLVRLKVK